MRDRLQAEAVATMTARYFTHLPFASDDLRMLPREVFDAARSLFAAAETDDMSTLD